MVLPSRRTQDWVGNPEPQAAFSPLPSAQGLEISLSHPACSQWVVMSYCPFKRKYEHQGNYKVTTKDIIKKCNISAHYYLNTPPIKLRLLTHPYNVAVGYYRTVIASCVSCSSWFSVKRIVKNNWRAQDGLLQEILHTLTTSFVHWTIQILRWIYLTSIMTFNKEGLLYNSFYSFSNYGWESTKCQPLSSRAVAKIKYFKIECITQDIYTMKIEWLMFALCFDLIWEGHQNILGLALISIWKKVIFRKINIFGFFHIRQPSIGDCDEIPPQAREAWRASQNPGLLRPCVSHGQGSERG